MGDERVTECVPLALSNDSHDILFYFLRNEALAQSDAIGQTLHMRVNYNSLLTKRMRKYNVGSLASDARRLVRKSISGVTMPPHFSQSSRDAATIAFALL